MLEKILLQYLNGEVTPDGAMDLLSWVPDIEKCPEYLQWRDGCAEATEAVHYLVYRIFGSSARLQYEYEEAA